MKIVQFKNGKYGVRRREWTSFWMELEFLSRYCWWRPIATPSIECDYTFDSIEEAKSIIKKSKEQEERLNNIWRDKGRKIKS